MIKEIYGRIVLTAALVSMPGATSAQTLVSERSISANAALEMATVALDTCRKHGSIVSITILDRADRIVVSVRDDSASPHSVEHSLRKAHTALTYDMPSAEFGKNAAKNPGNAGPLHLANITTAAGGLPIHAGTALVGAIGVSGTPGSKGGGSQDAACGQAGIDRIAKGLTGN
jgi:uncharacterized protein GlcG (DUF336 family)